MKKLFSDLHTQTYGNTQKVNETLKINTVKYLNNVSKALHFDSIYKYYVFSLIPMKMF